MKFIMSQGHSTEITYGDTYDVSSLRTLKFGPKSSVDQSNYFSFLNLEITHEGLDWSGLHRDIIRRRALVKRE